MILPFDKNHPPMPPKNIPMQTNTKVKPEMNNRVAKSALDFLTDVLASNPNPVMKERYPGTSGKTQGDKKEMIPALKENKIAINKEPWLTAFILPPN